MRLEPKAEELTDKVGLGRVVEPFSRAGASAGSIAKIGSVLEQTRRELLAIGGELGEILEPAGTQLTSEMQHLLDQQVCTIAVVGQIKAGKSSFINALVGRPDFLPTHLNPSTTAITRLHFNQPSQSGDAAVFHFFNEEQWRELASGTGPLRELTQRMVPGFEPALLRQSVFAVMSRAESRLGADYMQLLGRSHAFAVIEPATLMKYVCVGPLGDPGDVGLYSEVTRSADLYFDDGPFAFPVTLVDTPGTSDPFLVRDEITRRSLDKADAYVVVLSAHQPLSDGDLSLLRILRGLHKERIVVFINRIDELESLQTDLPEVIKYVRERLAIEFPGFEIPIVAGSAHYASDAQALALAKRTNSDDPSYVRFAGSNARPGQASIAAMNAALDELLARTHSAYVMRQVARCYSEMAQSCKAVARQELAELSRATSSDAITKEQANEELRQLVNEQQSLLMTRSVLDRVPGNLELRLNQILEDELGLQRERLIEVVNSHARYERSSLIATMRARRSGRSWACDVDSLRRELEAKFNAGFSSCEEKLLEYSANIVGYLNPVFEVLIPGAALPNPPARGTGAIEVPSLSSLGRPVALDLDVSWWARLWQTQPTAGERGGMIEQLIKEEFHPVVESLVASQKEAFLAYIALTTHWTAAACNNIIQALARRYERLASHLEEVRTSVGKETQEMIARHQQEAIAVAESRLAIATSAASRLATTMTTIDTWFDGPTRRRP